jgi:hypothetical protein
MLETSESKSTMSSRNSGGTGKLGRRSEVGGYIPREGLSAGFSLLGTFEGCRTWDRS